MTMAAQIELDEEGPLRLGDGSIALLGDSALVDGRISWYPDHDLGRYVPFNAYLVRDGDACLMIESGVPAHAEAIARDLRALLDGPLPSLVVTRNEPDTVSNIPNLVRDFGLAEVHSLGLMNTLQFFPDDPIEQREASFTHRATELQMLNFGVRSVPAVPGGTIAVGPSRAIEVIAAPLRVLSTLWLYDPAGKVLFTSDSFSDETAARPGQRTVETLPGQDVLVPRALRNLALKFDWLARSDIAPVIADVAAIFDRLDIETLAPSRGLVVQGRAAVAAKQEALLTALDRLQRGDAQ